MDKFEFQKKEIDFDQAKKIFNDIAQKLEDNCKPDSSVYSTMVLLPEVFRACVLLVEILKNEKL